MRKKVKCPYCGLKKVAVEIPFDKNFANLTKKDKIFSVRCEREFAKTTGEDDGCGKIFGVRWDIKFVIETAKLDFNPSEEQ